ncbi:caspase family protein [Cronbergia sp. UHCC 0137]|uniref:caspase family protein n=1 Tax=Cronbergia sp. UHCC 0137 TaxID=3110239 RepID=UPI002B1F3532|nr:caspase family protein [Cronbergia sp. UHCC 0137]MEA5616731.1 caspase family protein [Cronbergia sp. UHCC 0137]
MGNYWAIAIGINQYQLFQPLSCAQTDAEALKDFLVTEAGFASENCLLMTNTTPPIGDRSSYPSKENILLVLEELAATSWQPEDNLWFFFSGYGVNHQNKDYLMPIEGNPEQVCETGIEVRSLMQSLQVTGLNVLLIFDINRAFGTQADAPVGEEIIELAQELQMAAILSCQPEEFSHESSEIGYGFFTAALLEALRSGNGNNLANLETYLSSLTPKLCQHHWRPIQNPVIVIPSVQQAILPGDHNLEPEAVIFPEDSFAISRSAAPFPTTSSQPQTTDQDWWSQGGTVETRLNPSRSAKGDKSANNGKSVSHVLATSPELNTGNRFIPSAAKLHVSESHQDKIPVWKQFILWGGGSMIVVGLVATFLLRNQAIFRFKELPTNSTNNSTSDRPIAKPIPALPAIANPPSNPTNQALAELKKMSLQPTQASDLSTAIAKVSKIKPNEPLYSQAQENIQIWSQMILDLAGDRAKKRQYPSAIAAAELINQNSTLYPQSQTAIKQWRIEAKQYLTNKTVVEAASSLIQTGQASTYNRAIEVAKKVSPGEPGSDIAQKSINQWSEKIFDLAKKRAAQGKLTDAIATASLVPEATAAYQDAQDAIKKWQVSKTSNR